MWGFLLKFLTVTQQRISNQKTNTALTPYNDPVIQYPNLAMDRALEQFSNFLPKTKDNFSHLTNLPEVNVNKILGKPLVNVGEFEPKPTASKSTINIAAPLETAVPHNIIKNKKAPTTTKARGRPKLRPVGHVVCRFKGCNVVGFKLKNGACELHQADIKRQNAK